MALVLLAGAIGDAGATEPTDAAKSATPHRIAVIGDSLAQDLWNGLKKLYRGQKSIEIIRYTKVSTGLVRDDVFDWNDHIKQFVAEHDFDTAIVLMGGNDRQGITIGSKRLRRFGKAWTVEYTKRVADMIEVLKSETTAVYWLGLPIVRSNRMARDYRRFNKVYRAQAEEHGIAFIDTWPLYDTEEGKYTSFGPDAEGVKRRLRKDDGLHFTVAGKLRFAKDIVRIIAKQTSAAEVTEPPESLAQQDAD